MAREITGNLSGDDRDLDRDPDRDQDRDPNLDPNLDRDPDPTPQTSNTTCALQTPSSPRSNRAACRVTAFRSNPSWRSGS